MDERISSTFDIETDEIVISLQGLLFSVGVEVQSDLNKGIISEGLRQKFENNGVPFSDDASVLVEETNARWLITDRDKTYIVKRQEGKLNIYLHMNVLFHCHEKEDFVYDFYWKLAEIEYQYENRVDEDFIVDAFLNGLEFISSKETTIDISPYLKRLIRAKIANFIAVALSYRIRRSFPWSRKFLKNRLLKKSKRYVRWQKKILARAIQKNLAWKSDDVLGKIAQTCPTSFEDIEIQDQNVLFIFGKQKYMDLVKVSFHLDPNDFLNDFLSTYSSDREKLQLIIEDLWKILLNPIYQKEYTLAIYTLATNFIMAFRLEEARLIREQNEYEYLRWHKERLRIALRLNDVEKIEEATGAWVNLLASEEQDFIDRHCNREEEMKDIVFEDSPEIEDLFIRLETDRNVLQSISAWFLRKYRIGTGIKLIWRAVRRRRDSKLARVVPPYILLSLFALIPAVVLVCSVDFYQENYIMAFVIIVVLVLVSLFLASSIYCIFLRVNILRLFLPRVLMGVIIGWLGFLATEELWKYTLFLSLMSIVIVGAVVAFIVWFCIYTEIYNKVKKNREAALRAAIIFVLGVIESLLIGLLACTAMGKPMIENSGILTKSYIDNHMSELGVKFNPPTSQIESDHESNSEHYPIDVLSEIPFYGDLRLLHRLKFTKFVKYEFRVYPSILFVRSIFALFVGITLQLLWEDKPVTEPL